MNLFLLLVWLATLTGPPSGNLPAVAVLEEPMASRWLTAAGVQHANLTAQQVAAGDLVATQILILPVARVRTPAVAQAVMQFVQRGGSVIAVYWGPVVRGGSDATPPCYLLPEMLGARPAGWRGTGPITVRPEAPPVGAATETTVPRGILVALQPAANAQILARWAPAATARRAPPSKAPEVPTPGAAAAPGTPAAPAPAPPMAGTPAPATGAPATAAPSQMLSDVAVVRMGNVIYTGIDLFAPPNDTPAVRQLFLSFFEQLAPGLAFDQAREQAGAVMTAIIRAEAQLREAQSRAPGVDFSSVGQSLNQARDAAVRARQSLVRERYLEAETSIESARSALQQALQLLQKLTNRTP
jgi:hypothetical protein